MCRPASSDVMLLPRALLFPCNDYAYVPVLFIRNACSSKVEYIFCCMSTVLSFFLPFANRSTMWFSFASSNLSHLLRMELNNNDAVYNRLIVS